MSDDVRIEYPDGTYTGEASIDGKTPEGVGMFRWSDGTVYVGRWHSGKRQGHGNLRRPGKWVYDGDFEGDALTGRGIMTWATVPATRAISTTAACRGAESSRGRTAAAMRGSS